MQTNLNQRGLTPLLIIIGVFAVLIAGYFIYKNQSNLNPNITPSPIPATLSDDPKYQEVKEKYNLSEEQLQILSTVNPDDND